MSRSAWKGPYIHPSLVKKTKVANEKNDHKPIKTCSRGSTIVPLSKIWSDINLVNLRQHAPLRGMPQIKRPRPQENNTNKRR